MLWFFFFFSSRRRHTRYWRDWSSDVCSSDLGRVLVVEEPQRVRREHVAEGGERRPGAARAAGDLDQPVDDAGVGHAVRSGERRVGKECRSRWSPDHLKKKKNKEGTSVSHDVI